MLKPVEMRELRIVTLDEFIDGAIKRIESLGTVHLTDIKKFSEVWGELIEPSTADVALLKSSDLLTRLDSLIALLQPAEEGEKKSLKDKLLKEPEEVKIERVKIEKIDLEEIERELSGLEETVHRLTETLGGLKEELAGTEEPSRALALLEDFGIDVDFVGDKEFVCVYVGDLPSKNLEELRVTLDEVTEGCSYIASKEVAGAKSFAVIVTLKKDKEPVRRALRMADFDIWKRPSEELPVKTKEAIAVLQERIKQLEADIRENELKLEEIGRERCNDLLVLRELVQVEENRAKAKVLFGKSERTRVIEGWTPKDEIDAVINAISDEVGGFCVIEVKEPKRDDVRVPSLLKNPSLIRPFESIIKMYGAPSYNDIDPTIITAILFPVLFGFMFPDIGHGLILLLLGLVIMFAFKGLSKELRGMGIIIVLCGLCATIAGALFGEFFGFSEYASHLVHESVGVHIHPVLVIPPFWFEPIPEIEFMFVVAMVIGTLHMGLGLFLNGVNNFSNKKLLHGIGGFVKMWCLFGALYFLLLLFGFHFTEMSDGNVPVLLRNATIFVVLPILALFVLRIIEELRHVEHSNGVEGKAGGYGLSHYCAGWCD
jgi:V/A-type H+-transporting ATPase subunit I